MRAQGLQAKEINERLTDLTFATVDTAQPPQAAQDGAEALQLPAVVWLP